MSPHSLQGRGLGEEGWSSGLDVTLGLRKPRVNSALLQINCVILGKSLSLSVLHL